MTGGGSGIGLAAVKIFAAEGAIVAINDDRSEAADAAVAEVRQAGGRAMAIAGDVAQESAVHASAKAIIDQHKRIDVLISNAGVPIRGPAEEYSQWRRSVSVIWTACSIGHRRLPSKA